MKLLLDTPINGKIVPAGTPVEFVAWRAGDQVEVKLPNGETAVIDAARVQ